MTGIFPIGAMLDFTGISLEDGNYPPGKAVYIHSSSIEPDVSLILYIGTPPTAEVFAVSDSEISLADDQSVEEFDKRKKFILHQVLPAINPTIQ